MPFRSGRVALLLLSLPLAGCGTVANLAASRSQEGGTVPFGGVHRDLQCLRGAANGDIGYRGRPKAADQESYPRTALMLLCAADLPLSLAADTVLWPYTKAYAFINQPTPTPAIVQADPPVPQTTLTPVPVMAPPAPPTMPVPAPPPMPAPVPPLPPVNDPK